MYKTNNIFYCGILHGVSLCCLPVWGVSGGEHRRERWERERERERSGAGALREGGGEEHQHRRGKDHKSKKNEKSYFCGVLAICRYTGGGLRTAIVILYNLNIGN